MKCLIGYARTVVVLMVVLLVSLSITACSGGGDEKTAGGGVDKMTSDVAEVVVEKVKSPLDAARMTTGLAEKRLGEIDEELEGK